MSRRRLPTPDGMSEAEVRRVIAENEARQARYGEMTDEEICRFVAENGFGEGIEAGDDDVPTQRSKR